MPYYICPQCKERSIDNDGREGFSRQAPACHHCGFGFLFELTGFPETDLIGRDLVEALSFSDAKPVELAREWGVRRLGEQLSIRTRSGHEKAVIADVFPAYDDDGGLLIALTPKR